MAAQLNNRSSVNEDYLKPISINHLYKKYPNGYVAIRDNSFSVGNQ